MTYRDLKNKIKQEQKTLAQQIKNGKTGLKPKNRNGENHSDWDNLWWNCRNYRHQHIAYCQFFNNTPYALIEQPRDNNRPDTRKVDKLKIEWEGQIDEALRNCA